MIELTNDELNDAIMEAHGWSKLPFPAMPKWQKPSPVGAVACFSSPNYAEDIAAAYALEDEIPEVDQPKYVRELHKIIDATEQHGSVWGFIHATARQRCEAWLALKKNTYN
jgi:hypothetical protein